jgi:hypothetical protein
MTDTHPFSAADSIDYPDMNLSIDRLDVFVKLIGIFAGE